jgi:orotate phosphoribosyltransferase
MNYQQSVAEALLSIHAVKYVAESPITFKSGIVSPVYVDNRTIPYHPAAWKQIITGFADAIQTHALTDDIIAGVAVGGVPHSAALAYALQRPSVFIRAEAKAHGTNKLVEGGNVDGKNVLLIEDLVTTGGSSLRGVEALRASGAHVNHALAIVTYDFPEMHTAFQEANVQLIPLTSFPVILQIALDTGYFTPQQAEVIRTWLANPTTWSKPE